MSRQSFVTNFVNPLYPHFETVFENFGNTVEFLIQFETVVEYIASPRKIPKYIIFEIQYMETWNIVPSLYKTDREFYTYLHRLRTAASHGNVFAIACIVDEEEAEVFFVAGEGFTD